MQTKIRRFLYKMKRSISRERVLAVLAVVVAVAFVSSSVATLSRNWELDQRITTRRGELELLKLEIETLQLENEYYASEEYQELSARAKQNKIMPGEFLVYLPANSDIARNKHKTVPVEDEDAVAPSNIRQWMSFLFGS